MNSFEQRRADRKDWQADRAARLQREASSAFATARRIGSVIPMGQPILVGHHSEKRHRRDLKRINDNMRKGIERQRASEEAGRRANTESTAISSDDPDAADKLAKRIAKLEAQQSDYGRGQQGLPLE